MKKLAILGAIAVLSTAGLFGAKAFASGPSPCPLAGTPDCPLAIHASCCVHK